LIFFFFFICQWFISNVFLNGFYQKASGIASVSL
jgi:hypothetical protein